MAEKANAKGTTGGTVAVDVTGAAYMEAANFGDLMAMAGDNLAVATEVFGDGYAMVDQDKLVGVEFIVNGYREVLGDFGVYASVTAILRTPIRSEGELVTKIRFNDGGTGILDALSQVTPDQHGNFRPVHCRKGLKLSKYTKDLPDKDGVVKPTECTTYYFDTSA